MEPVGQIGSSMDVVADAKYDEIERANGAASSAAGERVSSMMGRLQNKSQATGASTSNQQQNSHTFSTAQYDPIKRFISGSPVASMINGHNVVPASVNQRKKRSQISPLESFFTTSGDPIATMTGSSMERTKKKEKGCG